MSSSRLRAALVVLLVALTLGALGVELTMPLLIFYASDNLGIDYAEGGGAWFPVLYGVVATAVGLLASSPLDKLPSLRIMLVAALGAGVARASIPFLPADDRGTIGLALLLCVVAPACDALFFLAGKLAIQRLVAVQMLGESKEDYEHAVKWYISVDYALFNVAAFVADAIYDPTRSFIAPSPAVANIWAFWASGACAGLAIVLLLVMLAFLIKNADRPQAPGKTAYGTSPIYAVCCSADGSGRFWRFMGLCTVLVGVRSLFRHLETTLSVYMTHEAGTRAHFAWVQAVNPLLIVVLSPLVPRLLKSIPDYTRFIAGTTVSVSAPLGLGIGLGVAVLTGTTLSANALTGVLVAFVAVFSFGEIIWSPLLSSYALLVAPESVQALFLALASLPSVGASIFTGALSAALVKHFCASPPGGPAGPSAGSSTPPAAGGPAASCDGAGLWTSIGLMAATTPALLVILHNRLREKDAKETFVRVQ